MTDYRLDYQHGGTTVLTFRLHGDDLDPAAITRDLGVTPDSAWRKGEAPRGGPAASKTGKWKLAPPCSPHDSFESQLDHLLTLLEGLPAALVTYTARFKADIFVGMTSYADTFGFDLNSAVMQRLSRLNCAILFDLYYVGPRPDDDEA